MLKFAQSEDELRELLGDAFMHLLPQLDMILLLEANSDEDVLRLPLGNGECAWFCQYSKGWRVLAVAPMGDRCDAPAVKRSVFFGKGAFPDTWRTRVSVSMSKNPDFKPKQTRTQAIGVEVGSYVCGTLGKGDLVRLCAVAEVDEAGRPARVFYDPQERAAGVSHPADEEERDWWAITAWPKGVVRVFEAFTPERIEAGKTKIFSYRWCCMRCGMAQYVAEAQEAKAARLAEEKPAAEQNLAIAMLRPGETVEQRKARVKVELAETLKQIEVDFQAQLERDRRGEFLKKGY